MPSVVGDTKWFRDNRVLTVRARVDVVGSTASHVEDMRLCLSDQFSTVQLSSKDDAIRVARLLSRERGAAHAVFQAATGAFLVSAVTMPAESGAFRLDPKWLHARGVHLLRFVRNDPRMVALVDGRQVVDATTLPFEDR